MLWFRPIRVRQRYGGIYQSMAQETHDTRLTIHRWIRNDQLPTIQVETQHDHQIHSQSFDSNVALGVLAASAGGGLAAFAASVVLETEEPWADIYFMDVEWMDVERSLQQQQEIPQTTRMRNEFARVGWSYVVVRPPPRYVPPCD